MYDKLVIYGFILVRVLANSFLNLFQKKLTNKQFDPFLLNLVTYISVALVTLPVFLVSNHSNLSSEFWFNIFIVAISDALANFLLVSSIHATDLSIIGPLNAYKAVFGLIFAMILLKEQPSLIGVLGILIIIFGSYLLNYSKKTHLMHPFKVLLTEKGVWYRIISILLFSVNAIFLKRAYLASDMISTLTFWAVLGSLTLLFFIPLYFKSKRFSIKPITENWKSLSVIVFLFLLVQIGTFYTFGNYLIGYSYALFQLSGLINVVLGYKFFNEKNLKSRLIGGVVMIAGAALILGS